MKPNLFDILVTLPAPYSQQTAERAFPKISLIHNTGGKPNQTQQIELKATQRDARRYAMLRRGLRQFSNDRPTSVEQDQRRRRAYLLDPASLHLLHLVGLRRREPRRPLGGRGRTADRTRLPPSGKR